MRVDRGAKRHLLRRVRADALLDVSAAQGLGRPSFLDHQLERIIFVDRDLLVLEQFEEAIVGNVLDVRVSAAAEKDGQSDEGKGDGDEDDAAPVEARLVSAGFVLLFGVTIRLGHEMRSARYLAA